MKSENITLINHIELILRELVEVAEKLNVLSTQAPWKKKSIDYSYWNSICLVNYRSWIKN